MIMRPMRGEAKGGHPSTVTVGLDPRVQAHGPSPVFMDSPIKPGHDGVRRGGPSSPKEKGPAGAGPDP